MNLGQLHGGEVTHTARCSRCNVGVSGDLETCARWACVHAELVHEVERVLVESASACRLVELDERGEHRVELQRILVDPRPLGTTHTREG